MENINENICTPPEQVIPEDVKPKTDKKSLILVLIIVVLFVLLLITGGIFAYQSGLLNNMLNIQQQEDEGIEEDQIEDETSIMKTTFEGETVTALVPDGWTVEEYYDGEGTESLVEGVTYEGFTGLKIKNGTKEVFSVRAVSGIGIIGCPMYAKFSDYNPTHLADNQAMADEIGDTMNITDYTTAQYVEFKWLDKTFRRIGTGYFYDEVPNNSFFEAPCMQGIITFNGLKFVDSSGYESNAYFFGAVENVTEEELLVVDEILESMRLVN